jgi:Na+-translocating ferredoxin:NAD+ oxidoreductase subunit D
MKPLTGFPVLTVSAPPFVHCGRTVRGHMQDAILALSPAMLLAIWAFGLGAFRVLALSAAVAVLTEVVCAKLMEKAPDVDDLNSLVIGLIFAFLLPASAPWWLVASGSALSVALGKMAFGGLGGGPLCPPLVGWAVCRLSWKPQMDVDASMLATHLTYPLGQLKYFGLEAIANYQTFDLVLGRQLGGLGEVQVLALVIGGLWLIFRKRIRLEIPVAFLAGLVAVAWIFKASDPGLYAGPFFHLAAGGAVFGAFFLAPDGGSSPSGKVPMILFGLLGGAMSMVIRVYGVYPDGVPFAILLANLCAPLLDRLRPKPFGGGRPCATS